MEKQNTVVAAIRIDADLWRRWKVACAEDGVTLSSRIAEFVERELQRRKNDRDERI